MSGLPAKSGRSTRCHTYAKLVLENGRRITWLSRHLGHSSLKITTDVYGHFERAERKAEAERMAGVFGV